MSHHTPGPWRIEHSLSFQHIHAANAERAQIGSKSNAIATVLRYSPDGYIESDANARLITAAPALYAACLTARDALVAVFSTGVEIDELNAALALVEGK